ncbi:Hypothetical protein R9X50_00694500 [Acrodontium crateriforme]|uniref:Uncharacterized protein n=1 Tax=Acrodontium crateriforme TaxID=150365 RepID=A0AAQ3MCE7_9PEZI|nr:Hypothetical protein R9X50_00694500 [Acrodontium crateriforme]
MPQGDPGHDATNELGSSHGMDNHNANAQIAAQRLAEEAKEASSYGARGISDVTKAFTSAAQKLQPGQLVKDDYFTLFEAVGALEIMDPKMDSGYVPPGDTFEATFDVCKGLPAAEILWIMDELFRLEIAWFGGYPLSQTVFTSLHLDRLLSPDNKPPYTLNYGENPTGDIATEENLVHIVLRSYCIALAKCLQYVLGFVQSQNFYEEEDFVTHLFGRELLPKLGFNDADALLNDASTWLQSAALPSEYREALQSRLQFRKSLLTALNGSAEQWISCISAIEAVNKSHGHGIFQPEAFSDKVQRQLATSTPPRPVLKLSWDDACKQWTEMCQDIIEANRLTSAPIVQSASCLQRATWAFAYREPAPNTFTRAHMQSLLFGQDIISNTVSHFELFLTDIKEIVLTGHPLVDAESFQIELPSDPRHQCSRIIESFMDKAFDEYLNLYRMVCQNRCRIRRTFTQAIPILDELETLALGVDTELDNITPLQVLEIYGQPIRLNPLSNWTKFHKLQIVTWTVQLGFETDIYLPHELYTMYWLLLWYTSRQRQLLLCIEPFVLDRMKTLTKRRQTQQVVECLAAQDWLKSQGVSTETTHLISKALWRLYSMLMATHLIKTPKRQYAQESLLWDARMKSFFGLTNDPVPSLEDFVNAQHLESVQQSCRDIDEALKDARTNLSELRKMTPQQVRCVGTEEQWKREIKQMETTCVAIAVQTSQVLRVCAKNGDKGASGDEDLSALMEVSIPAPGSRYHDWWVVPLVKEKK